jgi:hypothetical protein
MQIREHLGPKNSEAKPRSSAPGGHRGHVRRVRGEANRLAHHFRCADLRKGDVVAILMEKNEHIHANMWVAQRKRAAGFESAQVVGRREVTVHASLGWGEARWI